MRELRIFGAARAFALSLMMALLAVTATARAADVKTSDPFPRAKRAAIDDALARTFRFFARVLTPPS